MQNNNKSKKGIFFIISIFLLVGIISLGVMTMNSIPPPVETITKIIEHDALK